MNRKKNGERKREREKRLRVADSLTKLCENGRRTDRYKEDDGEEEEINLEFYRLISGVECHESHFRFAYCNQPD